jgi:hypothetical protein
VKPPVNGSCAAYIAEGAELPYRRQAMVTFPFGSIATMASSSTLPPSLGKPAADEKAPPD